MIYTTITNSIVTRDYKLFCVMMDIRHGSGTARYRTPAENRTVTQFLLSVNTGRRAVFINFNRGIAAIVEARPKKGDWSDNMLVGQKLSYNDMRRINLYNSSFEGSSKELRTLFYDTHTAFSNEVRRYSWQNPILSAVSP